jgi:uncharacterized damage-inducible protein DinB
MTKNEFIHILTTERQHWETQWKDINLTALAEPSSPGKMNLRDILYHVAWYERAMVEVLQLRALVGSPWWDLTLDERNACILAEGQSAAPLEAYLQEQQVYKELLALLNQLSDDELEQASFFRDMPPEWKPWEMIASNTYEHYPQHINDINP